MKNTFCTKLSRPPSFFLLFLFVHLFAAVRANAQLTNPACADSFFVKFPDDLIITACDSKANWGIPRFYGPGQDLIATKFEDDTSFVDISSCMKISRTWTVITFCSYDPKCDFVRIPNPVSSVIALHASNLPGPIVSNISQPGDPWAATVAKVSYTSTTPTNFASFWRKKVTCNGASQFNGYIYTQLIYIIDNSQPQAQCTPVDGKDATGNDSLLWSDQSFWDSTYQTKDLAEGTMPLSLTASDLCSGGNLRFRYELFLDLNGDGKHDTQIESNYPPAAGTIVVGTAPGTQTATFDKRNVSALDKYGFALEVKRNASTLPSATAFVRFNTLRTPGTFVAPLLPYGKHRIKWIVTDQCGNETTCEQAFVVQDGSSPKIACKPVFTNIGQGGTTSVEPSHFLEDVADNLTPDSALLFSLSAGEPAPLQFPRDASGQPVSALSYDCKNLGSNVVQLWVQDRAGNASSCQTTLMIQDNSNHCYKNTTLIGTIRTEAGKGVEKVEFLPSGTHPAFFPLFLLFKDSAGYYRFSNAIPVLQSSYIIPYRNHDPLNGVTAFDLNLIALHIAGVKKLSSPYKIIAADADKSGSVNGADLTVLRRLILGLDKKFLKNTSWRFVALPHTFLNPQNPFQKPFPESVHFYTALEIGEFHFVGIKTGDVDGSAQTTLLRDSGAGDRTAAVFDVQDRMVQTGERAEVTFESREALIGQQFTLEYPGMEVLSVESLSPGMQSEHFGVLEDRRVLTHAWNSSDGNSARMRFKVHFKALQTGYLRDLLAFSDRVTPALAYTETGQAYSAELNFLPAVADPDAFAFLPPSPNPFHAGTSLYFHLAEAAAVTLRITDVTGRVLTRQIQQREKGTQRWDISGAGLPSGILLCTLNVGTQQHVWKMVRE